MLSPNPDRVTLLPIDRQLMAALDLTELEYRDYVRYCKAQSKIVPSGPIAFDLLIGLALIVIGLITQFVAQALIPQQKNKTKQNNKETQVRMTSQQGINSVQNSEFAPKAGFDGVQQVVELGSTIPLVYTRKTPESGGVRINMPLLWSQLWSVGGSQLLRAQFLLSEGTISEIDKNGFAIGDNTINNFAFLDSAAAATSSKITLYFAQNGGRLAGASFLGRTAANDPANAENSAQVPKATDVFQTRGLDNTFVPWFSNTSTPSTTKDFGIYTLLPNDMGLRINPQLSSNTSFELRNVFDKPNTLYEAQLKWGRNYPDTGGIVQFWKSGFMFSGRSGITKTSTGGTTLKEGDTFTYTLSATSDKNTKFKCNNPQDRYSNDGETTCEDIASVVSSRQKTADDALSIGDVFKAGSCLAVLVSRTPADEIFVSEADITTAPQPMSYEFKVIRAGRVSIIDPGALDPVFGEINISGNISPSGPAARVANPPRFGVASTAAQIFKYAAGGFTIDRAARVIEVGFRSVLGINAGGICNFRSALDQYDINRRAGLRAEGAAFDATTDQVTLQSVSTDSQTMPLTRYSFFKISYRDEKSTTWTEISEIFGARSQTQQNVFNYLRFILPTAQRWEFKMEQLTSWEIRNVITNPKLNVMDSRIAGINKTVSGGLTIYWSGESVTRSAATFRLAQLESDSGDLGLGYSEGDSFFDTWGAIAEGFVYQEVVTSAANGPEHSIAYVNTVIENQTIPQYDNMAIVGINMYASDEFNQLEQFSAYVNGGIELKRFTDSTVGPTNNFADVLYDMLTNSRYGTGNYLSSKMVDEESFKEAAAWMEKRKYFFDGAITEQTNIRSWGSTTASYFLLDFAIANGKFALSPSIIFDEIVPISGLFTSGNIIEDSFNFSYSAPSERQPIKVSVKWREEKPTAIQGSKGFFPVLREVLVTERGAPSTAVLQTIDISDFCTSQAHAVDVAKSLIRNQKYVSSTVTFQTTPDQPGLQPGAYFKLGLETINYGQPNNGAVTAAGDVVSFSELADGKYVCLVWGGGSQKIEEKELEFKAGKCLTASSLIFCIKDTTVQTQTYKIQSLSFNEEGNVEITATISPTDVDGFSFITADWGNFDILF